MTTFIDQIRNIAESGEVADVEFDDGTETELDPDTSQTIIDLFDALDEEEQKHFVDRSISADEFFSVLEEYQNGTENDFEKEYETDDEHDTAE